jgi:hypothetical protein
MFVFGNFSEVMLSYVGRMDPKTLLLTCILVSFYGAIITKSFNLHSNGSPEEHVLFRSHGVLVPKHSYVPRIESSPSVAVFDVNLRLFDLTSEDVDLDILEVLEAAK